MAFDIDHLEEFSNGCEAQPWSVVWWCSDVLVLVSGMTANIALLWLLLRDMKAISASKVLGLNLAVMDIIYLSLKPVNVIFDGSKLLRSGSNLLIESDDMKKRNSTYPPLDMAKDIFDNLNLVGCPLLLAFMCIERYLAVTKPVLYRRARKLEYRIAVSSMVWLTTAIFCVGSVLSRNATLMRVPISGLISILFIVMLICLGGVVRSLRKQSPAHTASGNLAHIAPQKAQVVNNVLLVVVPSVIAYFPVLVLFPLIFYLFTDRLEFNENMCTVVELCLLFPTLGVLIGPLFYFSKVKQVFCFSGTGETNK